CFVFIFSSVQIFRSMLRIPSEQGWHKAFFMWLHHLAVVSFFISTGPFASLKSGCPPHPSISSLSLDLLVAVLYSVVPPSLNPLIYGLRNQDLK
ncbi:O14K1 protein, partial [Tachuris rubrigastra]|nr:O14K1 protein [Tachuris rubrigastra]